MKELDELKRFRKETMENMQLRHRYLKDFINCKNEEGIMESKNKDKLDEIDRLLEKMKK